MCEGQHRGSSPEKLQTSSVNEQTQKRLSETRTALLHVPALPKQREKWPTSSSRQNAPTAGLDGSYRFQASYRYRRTTLVRVTVRLYLTPFRKARIVFEIQE